METLTGMQREQGDLRRAVEPEGNADSSDAAIDVELQLTQAEPPRDIFLAHRGKGQRTDPRQANLAAVGVTAEHERD